MYKNFFKRFLDFTLALCVLIAFSPVLLAVSVALHFANKGAGIFFTQARPGKNGKIFRVVKFKTMTDERDAAGTPDSCPFKRNFRRVAPCGKVCGVLFCAQGFGYGGNEFGFGNLGGTEKSGLAL